MLYRENVPLSILKQIVNCKDAVTQEYLADCVAQVFTYVFQLATLQSFMNTYEYVLVFSDGDGHDNTTCLHHRQADRVRRVGQYICARSSIIKWFSHLLDSTTRILEKVTQQSHLKRASIYLVNFDVVHLPPMTQ